MLRLALLILLSLMGALMGCQSGPVSELLLVAKDRTTYETPIVRVEAARAIAAQSSGEDTPAQQELLNSLARQIQTENDPLVREALAESIGKFPMPLADRVLAAGLSDDDPGVRIQCCRALGTRRSTVNVAELADAMRSDRDFDVRVAATKALGEIRSAEAVTALTAALEDNDPAMQYAGVQAMRTATGRDLGGDVNAYLALARGEATAPAVAAQPESSFLPSWLRR